VRDFLAAHAVPGVERVDSRGYARTVASRGGHALVQVRPLEGEDALQLRVRGATPAALFHISSAARRVFDLAADPPRIARGFAADPLLAPLVEERPGLRIAGAWDPFECAVGAILGQDRGAMAARVLAGRLVVRLGRPIECGCEGLTHFFPPPEAIAAADLDQLGVGAERGAAVLALARAVADGALDLQGPFEEISEGMGQLPGVRPSAAQVFALRALGDPDAFPAADPVLRRMAGKGQALSARALAERAEAWRPWRGYAAFQLWRAASDGAARQAHRLTDRVALPPATG